MNENQAMYDFGDTLTADEAVDEFNLTVQQAAGEEISSENTDTSVSKEDIAVFGGKVDSLNTEDIKQLAAAKESKNCPQENIVDVDEMEVSRELTPEEKEKQEKGKQVIIDGKEIIKEAFDDGVNTAINTGLGAKKIREYKVTAVYPKSKFAKAKESEESPIKKYLFMACACIAAGIFGGVYSNSYYVFQNGKAESALNTAFGWLTQFDTLPVTMTPFDAASFFAGVGVWGGILALIFLFSVLNQSTMKNSRVGREHGNAKIMNNNSFKKYKNRFMER